MGRGILSRLMTTGVVVVEPYSGVNGRGQATFGAPVPVQGFLDAQQVMVRSKDGEEVRSGATFYTALANESLFPLESLVTGSDGTEGRVLKINAFDTVGLIRRAEHVAINLT